MNGLWRTRVNVLAVLTLSLGGMATTTGCCDKGPAQEDDEAAGNAGAAVEDGTQ